MHRQVTENEWYFFTPRNRKYTNGERPNRCTGEGYWKATGADLAIYDRRDRKIGVKKQLVYYDGKQQEGKKTKWMMMEYRIHDGSKPKSGARTTARWSKVVSGSHLVLSLTPILLFVSPGKRRAAPVRRRSWRRSSGHGWQARDHAFLGHLAEAVLRHAVVNGGEQDEDGSDSESGGGREILRHRGV
ncbi:hypothetical protein BHM03_00010384 [Ensete ventricosum]|nr:hypothetical protein BHM03_00010384 [Ensete ventricosum]